MTELIWDGKYKDDKKTTPIRIALPFQTIETINESKQQRQKTLDFFAAEPNAAYGKEWRNRLIWGDKKYVLPSLLPEFTGKVNLIYIDPPFNVGSDFSFTATIADNPTTEEDETTQFVKQPSLIEQKAYRDTWGKGLDSYMQWFYETVLLLKEFLTANGSIYVHLDWHVSHYAKTILDEIFGYENFVNEIVWKRSDAHNDKSLKTYGSIHDVILYYRHNSNDYIWNRGTSKIEEKTVDRDYRIEENTGRHYRLGDLAGPGGRGVTYEINGIKKAWKWTEEKFKQADRGGKIYYTSTGRPFYKIYLDEHSGVPLQTLWLDCPQIKGGEENVKYPTQKARSTFRANHQCKQ